MEPEIKISKKAIRNIIHDTKKSAKAVDLVYVNDTQPGIMRIRKGKNFTYRFHETTVRDKEEIQRIKSLVIPPAWENVWICKLPNGHIQATGIDIKGRKQYRYHTVWNSLRNQTKFYHMWEFGQVLPKIRLQIEKDLALPGLSQEKVLATVLSLMERTNIRIGSNMYEKLYGSYGLTTLKDKHLKVNGPEMKFTFKGKKGIFHEISLKNRRLAKIVKQCQDIPGKELFQYYDENGDRRTIESGMVNQYIHQICGEGFSAKDFRTWNGTLQALLSLKELGCEETSITAIKKNIVVALDEVSNQLGNTRTVCRKYYVHPIIITLYENQCLSKYVEQLDKIEETDNVSGLTTEEKLLMKILEEEGYSVQ
jgi:DNA topoisomerase-1